MMQRSSPAPRGPRNSSPSIRGRGGIQKRKAGPTRTDRDGDLVMDAATTGEKRRSGRGQLVGDTHFRGQGSGRGRGGPSREGNLGLLKAQSAIIRGLNSKQSQANVLESRTTVGGTTLQIDGLSSSKAASNPDGGVESLLAFLERKASAHDPKSKPVKIKKVCYKLGRGSAQGLCTVAVF
jgi:nuclear RNA export factor